MKNHCICSIQVFSFMVTDNDSDVYLEVLGEDSVLLGESVDAVVRLSHPADGTADGVSLGGGQHPSGLLVNGGDHAIARRAFPWDVQIHVLSGLVLHADGCLEERSGNTKIVLGQLGGSRQGQRRSYKVRQGQIN